MASPSVEEVCEWLCNILKVSAADISVEISATSEGYCGDIIFATVRAKAQKKVTEVVIKCSKRNEELRQKLPVQHDFLNEILVYEKIFTTFKKFEITHGITDPFDNGSKYFGKFIGHNTEVIVLENLKENGYDLWNKSLPMPRRYLINVLRQYAKFHAISVAMQDQEPDKYEELIKQITPNIFQMFVEATDLYKVFETNIDDICELLQNELDDSIIQTWRTFKNRCRFVLGDFVYNTTGLKVVIHGDCWCNNYMFNAKSPENPDVAILDWQTANNSSPIIDLSYFLFCSISEEDLPSIHDLLKEYHETFANRLEKLGSNPNLYNFETFFEDWKQNGIFGLIMSTEVIKICSCEKERHTDIVDKYETMKIEDSHNNLDGYKKRMASIIKYAYDEGLISKEKKY